MLDFRKLDLRRRKLGMSRATLARRAKVSAPAVHRILSGKEPSPTVATIEALAGAMGMELLFRDVADPDELRERQAEKIARKIAGVVQGTMGLESQGVEPSEVKALIKRNVHRLLSGSNRRLWDE